MKINWILFVFLIISNNLFSQSLIKQEELYPSIYKNLKENIDYKDSIKECKIDYFSNNSIEILIIFYNNIIIKYSLIDPKYIGDDPFGYPIYEYSTNKYLNNNGIKYVEIIRKESKDNMLSTRITVHFFNFSDDCIVWADFYIKRR